MDITFCLTSLNGQSESLSQDEVNVFFRITHLCTLLDITCGALLVVSALVLVDGCAAVLRDALAFVVIHGAALVLGEHLNNNHDEENDVESL